MTTRGSTSFLQKRLLPLHIAVALEGTMLWPPIEKLFLQQIGFTAASVGLMAAAYAAVTPLLEVPSGILADRWSRRGVLILSAVALMASSLVGGLSNNVPLYIVGALLLGVYFAMYSGTVESIVYDLVLEETGTSDSYQVRIGRVRIVESIALVAGSLAGGWLASVTGVRATYFITVPFTALSIMAYARFNEPRLNRAGERVPLRNHIAVTYQTITRRGSLLPIIAVGALTALILQVIFEFGPLWLVALAAPAVLFGPYWAGLVSTMGLGGLLAGRLALDRPRTVLAVAALMTFASVVLNVNDSMAAVIAAQIVLALLLVTASIHVSALLHDAVPSTIRAGVASGVSTISWISFLPFALGFGWASREYGVNTSGWMITVVTAIAGALLYRLSAHHPAANPDPETPVDELIQAAAI